MIPIRATLDRLAVFFLSDSDREALPYSPDAFSALNEASGDFQNFIEGRADELARRRDSRAVERRDVLKAIREWKQD